MGCSAQETLEIQTKKDTIDTNLIQKVIQKHSR